MSDITIELIEIENFNNGSSQKQIEGHVQDYLNDILKPWREELITLRARIERLEFKEVKA